MKLMMLVYIPIPASKAELIHQVIKSIEASKIGHVKTCFIPASHCAPEAQVCRIVHIRQEKAS
jgi:hypothetical protein